MTGIKRSEIKETGNFWFVFRVGLANRLVRLASKIRPKTVNQFMKSIEDSFIYGSGVMRINPKDMFKNGNN